VRFLVDAQLPPALARLLIELGHEAQHVGDLDLLRASDRDIWHRASDRDAILITKDADFVTLRAIRGSGPAIVWMRIGKPRAAFCLTASGRPCRRLSKRFNAGSKSLWSLSWRGSTRAEHRRSKRQKAGIRGSAKAGCTGVGGV
jgi:predicted nuclease of predicted toxin-antitoxin system